MANESDHDTQKHHPVEDVKPGSSIGATDAVSDDLRSESSASARTLPPTPSESNTQNLMKGQQPKTDCRMRSEPADVHEGEAYQGSNGRATNAKSNRLMSPSCTDSSCLDEAIRFATGVEAFCDFIATDWMADIKKGRRRKKSESRTEVSVRMLSEHLKYSMWETLLENDGEEEESKPGTNLGVMGSKSSELERQKPIVMKFLTEGGRGEEDLYIFGTRVANPIADLFFGNTNEQCEEAKASTSAHTALRTRTPDETNHQDEQLDPAINILGKAKKDCVAIAGSRDMDAELLSEEYHPEQSLEKGYLWDELVDKFCRWEVESVLKEINQQREGDMNEGHIPEAPSTKNKEMVSQSSTLPERSTDQHFHQHASIVPDMVDYLKNQVWKRFSEKLQEIANTKGGDHNAKSCQQEAQSCTTVHHPSEEKFSGALDPDIAELLNIASRKVSELVWNFHHPDAADALERVRAHILGQSYSSTPTERVCLQPSEYRLETHSRGGVPNMLFYVIRPQNEADTIEAAMKDTAFICKDDTNDAKAVKSCVLPVHTSDSLGSDDVDCLEEIQTVSGDLNFIEGALRESWMQAKAEREDIRKWLEFAMIFLSQPNREQERRAKEFIAQNKNQVLLFIESQKNIHHMKEPQREIVRVRKWMKQKGYCP